MIAAGIDVGTQSIKVLVYDSTAHKILADPSEPLELIEGEGGLREQKAEWWIDGIRKCFSRIPEAVRKEIKVMAVSATQHSFVPMAADGSALYNSKLWCDTSTAAECVELEAKLGGRAKVAERLGNPVLPGYTASKILWLKKNHPDIYDKMAWATVSGDFVNFYLCGKAVTERGQASGTALMDIFHGNWDEEAAKAISEDLLSKLPPIAEKDGIIGYVTEKAASELGLSTDCQVASGGGDNMMSAIGTGSVADGIVTMSLGTSGTLFASSSKPFHDKENRLASFCSSVNTWLPLLCTMNCTVTSETMRKLFGKDVKAFDQKAAEAGPGAGGLVMLPFLNGERVPDYPHGEGVLLGMRQSNVTEENIARAALEGVTYEFQLGLDAFRENGIEVNSLILTGGGAKSKIWRQLVADMTGCPVKVPVITESAAFGAVLQGLWAIEGGTIGQIASEHIAYDEKKSAEPDLTYSDVYKACYERWLKYADALGPIFR